MIRSLSDSHGPRRLFEQREAAARVVPFAAVLAVAFAVYPLAAHAAYGGELAATAALAAAIVAAVGLVPWRRLPSPLQLLPLLAFLAVTALLRDLHGGAASGYSPLALLPVIWAGLFGSWVDVALVTVAAGLTVGLPVAFGADEGSDLGEIRRALLTALVAAIVGGGLALLMRALGTEVERRVEAERRLERLIADDIHDDIVQNLTAVQLGLRLSDRAAADRALAQALASAEEVVATMLRASGNGTAPGSLRRTRAPRDPPGS